MSAEGIVLVILGLYSILGLAIIFEKFRYLAVAGRILRARMGSPEAPLTIPALEQAFRKVETTGGPIQAAIDRELAVVGDRATAGMVYLATIGNTAPFVGLFGTVLGIMEAFRSIAEEGNPSFATVSGGLSAALVATAAGLAVAIPAVIFYNYFGRRIQSHLLETRYVLEHELAAAGKLTE